MIRRPTSHGPAMRGRGGPPTVPAAQDPSEFDVAAWLAGDPLVIVLDDQDESC